MRPRYTPDARGKSRGRRSGPAEPSRVWFDVKFHRADGPRRWANARLVRYADDFVILAKYVGARISAFVVDTLEAWMGLMLNRQKTRVVKLAEPKASVDFLAYTFRFDRDLDRQCRPGECGGAANGRPVRYLNAVPSKKALRKEREALRELTSPRLGFLPVPDLVGRLNRHLLGWKNYFEWGYSRKACREVNWFARARLVRHLRRRSQRPYRLPKGTTWYAEFERLGLVTL